MDLIILCAIVILIILVIILLLKKSFNKDIINSFLKDQFITFQSQINKELNSTRSEINVSKDKMSDHAIKTSELITEMTKQMQKLIQHQEDASKLGHSLKDLLQVPKLRGSYGEEVLEEMLERVLPKGVWERQYVIDGREKVDVAIKYRDVVVPIDSKFPRDDYQRYLNSTTDEEKTQNWRSYENSVKVQIRSINSKYVKPEKGTSDFALMFIPSEGVYYETIAEKNHLGDPSQIYEFAQENKVFPVSPNTFYAFLQIIIQGIRNIELVKNTQKLQVKLTEIQKSFEQFYKKHEDIGKNLEQATESYRVGNDHVERFKNRLDETLRLEGMNDTKEITEKFSEE